MSLHGSPILEGETHTPQFGSQVAGGGDSKGDVLPRARGALACGQLRSEGENPGRPQAGQEGPAGGTTPGGWRSAARTGPGRVANGRSSRFRGGVPRARTRPERGGSRPPGGRGRPRPRRRLPAPGSAPLRGRGDLGRRAASAGHGGVEPGRGSAAAPWDPRGEQRGRAALPGLFPGGRCRGAAGPAAAGARGPAPVERGAGPGGLPFLSLIHS